jgi:hypothetical protein
MIALVGAALAGGYFYSDSGIVATGRGGAFVAGADTQFAQYHNPAGLIRVQDPTFNLGFSSVQQHVRFTRLDADGEPLPVAENQAAPFVVPQLGFATPLVRGKLAMAIGMTSPFAPSSDYDPNGSQRYSIVDTSIYQFSLGPSFAWRPVRQITFGLGLQANVLILGQAVKVSATGQRRPRGRHPGGSPRAGWLHPEPQRRLADRARRAGEHRPRDPAAHHLPRARPGGARLHGQRSGSGRRSLRLPGWRLHDRPG